MKKVFFLWLIFKANLLFSMQNINTSGVCFIDLNKIKDEALFCIEKKQKLTATLGDIAVQLQIIKDELSCLNIQLIDNEISTDKYDEKVEELEFKIRLLDQTTDTVTKMYEIIIDQIIEDSIKEVMDAEKFSATLDIKEAVIVNPIFNITYKVLHKVDQKYINKVCIFQIKVVEK